MIKSFGQFVVGGNYVVGIVIFLILVVINFMVITKGAGRVAEVAARFTLDAMPGKQMAIDADLNAGLIMTRRPGPATQGDRPGSRLLRGDGRRQQVRPRRCHRRHHHHPDQYRRRFRHRRAAKRDADGCSAAQTYTILTVGDGLVGQIPALIISTAAGILVTRTAGTERFRYRAERTVHRPSPGPVGGVLYSLRLRPDSRAAPSAFLLLAGMHSASSPVRCSKGQKLQGSRGGGAGGPARRAEEENYEEMLGIDLLELEVGYGLIPLVDAAQDGELLPRIRSIRKQFALDMGFIVPPVHIKDNLQLKPNEYGILLKGVRIGRRARFCPVTTWR